ncbi:oligoendopeptidase F [Entomoplasma freundtii]|uniref:Oligopeptidase F n=1 Tax=Entomoplasma freundtii TaxID=74700 RepID=A0A2K8NQM9_9MOLU|nr:oligoendopeptidase F [Entomoplasma freundtii]ATZ16140.1 oligoendopeptidase F [Entomoplasma freundtii]TDY56959.1 oligoendopeptidase F [Entomoplasma freundtii]
MKRSEAEAKYKWDFSHLYPHTEAWKEDLEKLTKTIPAFENYKGKLDKKEEFLAYLDFNQQVDLLVNKLAQFLHYGDVDTSNQVYQELEGLLMTEFQKINVATAFLAPEIKTIGENQVLNWLEEDGKYHKYRYGLKMFFKDAPHILEDRDEELLSKVSRSRGHSSGLYDTLAYADRTDQMIDYHGEKRPLTTSLMMEISEDSDPVKDQKLRQEASHLFTKNFSDHKHSFASIYEGILLASTESTKLRNYKSALEASLIGDSIPTEVYFKLLEVGKKNVHLFKNYHQFLKDYFKLDKFYPTDRQLKMVTDYNRTFSVEEAQSLIREALKVLGPEYIENLAIAWSDHHIDYFEDTNKRDGAYSSGGAKLNPIILMNWDDKLNSVHTLAHESGHSVHTLLADANQPYPLSEYPIVLAEVASTINEHLLFDYMYKSAQTKEEKIYLLQQRIFDLLSTFTRQIQFAAFEHEAHELVEKGQPLTADILAKLFKNVQNEYGYDVFDEVDAQKLGYGWPRISHFFHSPYYVYKYAIDLVASYKLYHDIKEGNTATTLNFLKAGGHKEPLEILKDAGVDFTKEETYQPLIDGIQEYLEELKALTNA